jgi:chromosome segregation ATPase
MTEETRSKEFINNSKIERYVRLNTFVDLLEDSINKKQEQIDTMILKLGKIKFSYFNNNNNKNTMFYNVNDLSEEIHRDRQELNKYLIELGKAEIEAKGLEWIVKYTYEDLYYP